eukprot:jgi/Botrbrau1/21886/Bobra.0249s0015.1
MIDDRVDRFGLTPSHPCRLRCPKSQARPLYTRSTYPRKSRTVCLHTHWQFSHTCGGPPALGVESGCTKAGVYSQAGSTDPGTCTADGGLYCRYMRGPTEYQLSASFLPAGLPSPERYTVDRGEIEICTTRCTVPKMHGHGCYGLPMATFQQMSCSNDGGAHAEGAQACPPASFAISFSLLRVLACPAAPNPTSKDDLNVKGRQGGGRGGGAKGHNVPWNRTRYIAITRLLRTGAAVPHEEQHLLSIMLPTSKPQWYDTTYCQAAHSVYAAQASTQQPYMHEPKM